METKGSNIVTVGKIIKIIKKNPISQKGVQIV